MTIIKAPSVANAYENLIEKILKNGEYVETEFGEMTKELRGVLVEIINPKLKRISNKYPLGKRAVEQYTNHLLYGSENVFSYDYHERLFEWGNSCGIREVNQIDYIIKKLRFNKNSRRAVAITWIPTIDCNVEDDRFSVPCLQYVQFLIRNGELEMYVMFRSNDILLAFHSNAIGLISLGEMVAKELGMKLRKYTHYIVSAHIYVDRDKDYLEQYFGFKK